MKKRKNLIIYNLEEEESNYFQLESCVLSIINDGCQVKCENTEIDFIKRLGRKSNKIRPVLVGLTSWRKKMLIMQNKKLLKGSNLILVDDLPKDILQKQKELVPIMQKFRKEGRKAFIKFDEIMVDGKIWNEEEDQSRTKQSVESSPEITDVIMDGSLSAETTNSAVSEPGARKKQIAHRGKRPTWENSKNSSRNNWWQVGNNDNSSTYTNQQQNKYTMFHNNNTQNNYQQTSPVKN